MTRKFQVFNKTLVIVEMHYNVLGYLGSKIILFQEFKKLVM
jgi:hypothetical protein